MYRKGFIYKKIDLTALGERIKQLRGNESQASFAERFGVSQADISRLERGSIMNPSPELLFNICIYNKPPLPLAWLLTGEEPASEGEDPKLAALFEKLRFIFKQGGIREKSTVRGIIEEVYDVIQENLAKETEKAASKKGA